MLSKGADSTIAILHKNVSLTYAELRDRVGRIAGGLLAQGYCKGERVAILSENSAFQVVAYLAIIRAGLVAVPLQTELATETLAGISHNAGIKLAFVSKRFLSRALPWAAQAQIEVISESSLDEISCDSVTNFPTIEPATDLAALMFTSGSTGSPKGVMVSHRNIACNTHDIISYLGLTSADRVMVVLPFHYCFGASLLHSHLLAGASLVLDNEFRLYPEATLQEMQRTQCTGLAGVPSTYQILLRKSRFRQMSFPTLRWFQQAGGKLPNAFIQEIISAFPHVRFFLMYGQTEATARLSYLPPERLSDKFGSVGCGLPSTRLEILRPDGTSVPRGSDEAGEVVASGDNITLGYWNDAVETARFFRNGKLYTGDIARLDGDGFLFIVEREREIIKCGGHRVSAKEIEDIISELPDVVEVAVVGAPHELLGESIKAFVLTVPKALLSDEAIKIHCRRRLPPFKIPDEVRLVQSMPHNSAGKLLKSKLKELLKPDGLKPDEHTLSPVPS
jgi:acyl-CoA synthetase (AMP-forming)/AMP-acid ligase II